MDILDSAAIQMPCYHCGHTYAVPLSVILVSHKIMHNGCPAMHETECPPVFHSRLATESAIEGLQRAWRRLEKNAEKNGGELVLVRSRPRANTEASKKKGAPAPSNTILKRRSHAV